MIVMKQLNQYLKNTFQVIFSFDDIFSWKKEDLNFFFMDTILNVQYRFC